jgi:hypothetical protein
MPNLRDTFSELRTVMDGSDPFMTDGHQIISPRSDSRKKVPAWSKDDDAVKKLLLCSFPKLKTNIKHRAGAARWMRIIHMYYRVGLTVGHIAEELHAKPNVIKRVLISIRRAANGKSAAKGLARQKRGRPAKI